MGNLCGGPREKTEQEVDKKPEAVDKKPEQELIPEAGGVATKESPRLSTTDNEDNTTLPITTTIKSEPEEKVAVEPDKKAVELETNTQEKEPEAVEPEPKAQEPTKEPEIVEAEVEAEPPKPEAEPEKVEVQAEEPVKTEEAEPATASTAVEKEQMEAGAPAVAEKEVQPEPEPEAEPEKEPEVAETVEEPVKTEEAEPVAEEEVQPEPAAEAEPEKEPEVPAEEPVKTEEVVAPVPVAEEEEVQPKPETAAEPEPEAEAEAEPEADQEQFNNTMKEFLEMWREIGNDVTAEEMEPNERFHFLADASKEVSDTLYEEFSKKREVTALQEGIELLKAVQKARKDFEEETKQFMVQWENLQCKVTPEEVAADDRFVFLADENPEFGKEFDSTLKFMKSKVKLAVLKEGVQLLKKIEEGRKVQEGGELPDDNDVDPEELHAAE